MFDIERSTRTIVKKVRESFYNTVGARVEEYYFQRLGVRKEFPELNPFAAFFMLRKAAKYFKDNQVTYEGYPMPKDGPAILTGNHYKDSDIYNTVEITRATAGRMIRAIAKRSLIVKGATESKEYLQSIGGDADHEDDYNWKHALILRGVGLIDVLRDIPEPSVGRKANRALRNNQILGVFLQPTRYEDCLLRNLEPGAAVFAKLNPNVPIYPMAFSGPPHGENRVTVLEPFTYAQKVKEYGRELTPAELTIMIADMVVTALPESSQIDWATRWSKELSRLTPKK